MYYLNLFELISPTQEIINFIEECRIQQNIFPYCCQTSYPKDFGDNIVWDKYTHWMTDFDDCPYDDYRVYDADLQLFHPYVSELIDGSQILIAKRIPINHYLLISSGQYPPNCLYLTYEAASKYVEGIKIEEFSREMKKKFVYGRMYLSL